MGELLKFLLVESPKWGKGEGRRGMLCSGKPTYRRIFKFEILTGTGGGNFDKRRRTGAATANRQTVERHRRRKKNLVLKSTRVAEKVISKRTSH